MDKVKEVLWRIASVMYVAGFALAILFGIFRAGNEFDVVYKALGAYTVGISVFIFIGMIMSALDKKEITLERIASGVNVFRLAWWNVSHVESGYFLSIKNMFSNTVNHVVDIVDDILVFFRDIFRFILWLFVSVFLLTGIWLFVQLYKIPRMARATVRYKAQMEKHIRVQWPIYAANNKYAKADKNGRERLRHAFRMMYKLPDDKILLSMERQVLKGR